MPKKRSAQSSSSVIASTGVASTWMSAVAYMPQTKSGSRVQVMPGARIVWTVTRKFRPVRIDENPRMKAPSVIEMTLLTVCTLYGV